MEYIKHEVNNGTKIEKYCVKSKVEVLNSYQYLNAALKFSEVELYAVP